MTENTNSSEQTYQFIQSMLDPEKAMSISEKYGIFHNYSPGNTHLIISQLLDPEKDNKGICPVGNFNSWAKIGMPIPKGTKANVGIFRPIEVKKLDENGNTYKEPRRDDLGKVVKKADGSPVMVTATKKKIAFIPNCLFSYDHLVEANLSRDPGFVPPKYDPPDMSWELDKALEELDIEMVEYSSTKGNAQGHAIIGTRNIAINPLATNPAQTTFHEMAHVVLGHTGSRNELPGPIEEFEAETTAAMLMTSQGYDVSEESRGYILSHLMIGGGIVDLDLESNKTLKNSISHINKAFTEILKSGVDIDPEKTNVALVEPMEPIEIKNSKSFMSKNHIQVSFSQEKGKEYIDFSFRDPEAPDIEMDSVLVTDKDAQMVMKFAFRDKFNTDDEVKLMKSALKNPDVSQQLESAIKQERDAEFDLTGLPGA
jgi:hypothetical protein